MFESYRLTGNQLKMIGLLAMTCDHVGKVLLPQWEFLQIIGRLAFPIFAYMIAEGCRYTRSPRRYLLQIAGLALLCQIVYFVAQGSLYQCILVTFSLSIVMIYAIRRALRRMDWASITMAVLICCGVYFVCVLLPLLLGNTDFAVDYGFWGVLLPVWVYFVPRTAGQTYDITGVNVESKPGRLTEAQLRLAAAAAALIPVCISLGGIQWYSLMAVLLLALYSGKRGQARIKNLFFIYYPLHLAVIYIISEIFTVS